MKNVITLFLISLFLPVALLGLSSCGGRGKEEPQEAIIEETTGGFDILEREFGECTTPSSDTDYNEAKYVYRRPVQGSHLGQKQLELESQYPHTFSSLEQMYPERGTWRQSREEIMDLVDRHIWSPEEKRVVRLLHYFNMALIINTGDRTNDSPSDSSMQRMQVLIRQGSSDNLDDWKRIETWPISTGRPCGKKIATYTGVYKLNPGRIYSEYKSEIFDNADMYESMFLYHNYRSGDPTGVAIHGSYKVSHLGRRDSGGCIRLHRDNSQCLFETITGARSQRCLSDGELTYKGQVISLLPTNGEADPEFLKDGTLLVDEGYKVLVIIFNDEDDLL